MLCRVCSAFAGCRQTCKEVIVVARATLQRKTTHFFVLLFFLSVSLTTESTQSLPLSSVSTFLAASLVSHHHVLSLSPPVPPMLTEGSWETAAAAPSHWAFGPLSRVSLRSWTETEAAGLLLPTCLPRCTLPPPQYLGGAFKCTFRRGKSKERERNQTVHWAALNSDVPLAALSSHDATHLLFPLPAVWLYFLVWFCVTISSFVFFFYCQSNGWVIWPKFHIHISFYILIQ